MLKSDGRHKSLLAAGYLLVLLLGCVDYLTGDYSILLFYMLPVILVSWLQGHKGIGISLAAGAARLVSDYFTSSAGSFKYWTSLQDTVFLLLVASLVPLVKRLMTEGRQ